MARALNLDTYTCSPLPNALWRVRHSGTQSLQDSGTGDIVAASASTYAISDRAGLKQAAEDHFDWRCRRRSCFLLVFRCEEHALNWAKKLWTQDTVYIHEIDTTKLPRSGVHVFDAVSLTRELGIRYQSPTNELVFLYRIPGETITRTRSISEVEYGGDNVKPEISYIPITGPDSFDNVAIRVCPLRETTRREGSRSSTQDRYWKRTLSFSNAEGRTKVIRVDNVYVLKKTPKKGGSEGDGSYGTKFVNISIPGYVRNRVEAAIYELYPGCNVDEECFEPNEERWFKAIGDVEKILSVVTPNPDPDGEPIVKHYNVRDVLGKIKHAVKISAYLEIAVKAKATPPDNEGSPQVDIREAGTDPETVKVTAKIGLVTELDTGEVDMPRFARGQLRKVSASELTVTEADYASPSVLKKFSEMGLAV